MSNGTNMSSGSIVPTGDPPSSAGGGGIGTCPDVRGAFTSIVVCTGGAECIQGMPAAAALLGGWAATCSMSVAHFRERAL
eukprot:1736922-Prymnesium_polylepis.1